MATKTTEVGPWKSLKVLGSGGFGQVTLWQHSDTGEKIAIKTLHDQVLKDPNAKTKQRERWCKEVEIMKKLNHVNVVSTLETPNEFNSKASVPILAMEYCARGDLRGVLNKPENCSGLREPQILDVLRDVSNGLAYLHSCKIIHRDLKPDNIVLQEKDSRIIYKLIDLGYAKAFDQSSLSQSFVGTIQYIAPELFLGKAYTSSVDYWSFGLLTHEIITGYRPFLPGFNPSDWMRQIQNKSRNIICVLENPNGDITFSSSISRRNHLSRCYLGYIEKWMQLALDWDGQTRGRDLDKNRPIIFEELGNILRKKAVRVFSVPTYECLDYEVKAETDISDLRRWIKKDTDLEVDDQLLLLSNGKSLSMEGNLSNILKSENVDRGGISIFVYNSGIINIKNTARSKPKYVDELIEYSIRALRYRHLKRCCADSIFFLQGEAKKYRNLLRSISVKISHTKQKTLGIESLYEDVGNEFSLIESYSQFLSLSHKIDLENYINFRKMGKLKASPLVQKWIRNVVEVDKKINELKNSFNKNEQKQLVLVARQRCRNLDNHTGSSVVKRTPLDDIVTEGLKAWENIQKISRDEKNALTSGVVTVNLIDKAIEEADKLLNSQMIQPLFIKISEADENLAKFLSHLTTLLRSTKILKLVIENTQRERQNHVWNMITNIKEPEDKSNEKNEKSEKEKSLEKELLKVEKENESFNKKEDYKSNGSGTSSINLQSIPMDSSFFRRSGSGSDFELDNGLDASSIIDENNRLRFQIQDVQQSCHHLIKKLRSLNWNFGEEFRSCCESSVQYT